MVTARDDTYTCASGGSIDAGLPGDPLWMAGQPLNHLFAVPIISAAGLSGLNMDAYCGFALKPSNSELHAVAAGGHGDGSDNGAASLLLSDDTPTWTRRRLSTANGTTDINVFYYEDGSPCARHTYGYVHYIEPLDAVLLSGCRFGYGGGTPTHPGMDLFDLATNDYLPRYEYPDITPWPTADYGGGQDVNGNIWTAAGYKFNITTRTWSKPGTGTLHRYPFATDWNTNKIFSFQWGNGEGGADPGGYRAALLDCSTGNTVSITIAPGAALDAFEAIAPAYIGMDFDRVNGVFLVYHGIGAENGKIYRITPNAGTTWVMDVLATTGVPGTALTTGGIFAKRFIYVPALRGFVLMQRQAEGLYFIRTSI